MKLYWRWIWIQSSYKLLRVSQHKWFSDRCPTDSALCSVLSIFFSIILFFYIVCIMSVCSDETELLSQLIVGLTDLLLGAALEYLYVLPLVGFRSCCDEWWFGLSHTSFNSSWSKCTPFLWRVQSGELLTHWPLLKENWSKIEQVVILAVSYYPIL